MKYLISLLLLALVTIVSGQENWDNLVVWTADYNAESGSVDLKAAIEKGWVIYSQHTPDEGPVPLEIIFEEAEGVKYIGEVQELDEPIREFSKMFEIEVVKFKEKASFRQQLKLNSNSAVIKGSVTFMMCDKEKCLPPKTVPFEVKI